MTQAAPVLYSVENGVATITLNRPEVHNAFNEVVIAELTNAFVKAGGDDAVRVVVLRGNGKSFSAGGDLNWMRRMADYTREENIADAGKLGTLLKTINTCPKPTIALVQGNAFGGGVGLTACCDIALAEESAQFCLSEVRIGIIPSIILPYVITAIGERQARRYCLTAERFEGKTAARIGLAHEAVPVGGLDVAADKIIAALKDGGPAAQKRGKKLILDIARRMIDEDVIRLTVEQIAEARASDEGRDGLSAFLNKTEPSWRKK
jgi:methylglutaconyl-CoA hydratase